MSEEQDLVLSRLETQLSTKEIFSAIEAGSTAVLDALIASGVAVEHTHWIQSVSNERSLMWFCNQYGESLTADSQCFNRVAAYGTTSSFNKLYAMADFTLPTGCQLLHNAASTGNIAMIRHILTQDLEMVDDQRSSGETALHCAYQSQNLDAVRCLKASGADENIKDGRGLTPKDYAIAYGMVGA